MNYYLELKVVHILAFVSWMAALFYMPRLFVYHAENIDKKDFTDVVEVQEEKLYKYIAHPAMALSLVSGYLLLASNFAIMSGTGFMHAKLLLVFFLVIYHFSMGYYRVQLKDKTCKRGSVFFRFYNEVPTLMLIGITIFIVLRPF